ncbi:MAG: hypothetical protein Q8J64_00105 [Thermodesulfovibrionales bacterium]|nr:hypothetical protein [Thermodesulfovibrionales bacterium]
MKNALAVIIAGLLLFGCSKAVRYSPGEIQGFPPAVQEEIKAGEISHDMTMVQVRYAWGGPSEVVLHKPEDGKHTEEWVYGKGLYNVRLIFTDGALTKIISVKPVVQKPKQ